MEPSNSKFTTVKSKTGYDGLYKLNLKMVNLALSWKFLQDVDERNIGTNEIEMEKWKREATREEKITEERPLCEWYDQEESQHKEKDENYD